MKASGFKNLLAATALATGIFTGLAGNASASPLDSSWTQVGLAQVDGGMFDGNCNLINTCNFTNGGDYWQSFPMASEILFITGDRQYWGQASYATVLALVNAAGNVFSPNLQWIDAGRNGASIGAAVGNLLQRTIFSEDPWITLQGGHCNLGCSEILWGETNYGGPHMGLMNNHGGLEVYVRGGLVPDPTPTPTPEPASLPLLGLALASLAWARRKRA